MGGLDMRHATGDTRDDWRHCDTRDDRGHCDKRHKRKEAVR